jgi:hypothetical protein
MTMSLVAAAQQEGRPFDEAAVSCLTMASGLAQATKHPRIGASHLLLAVLHKDADRLDAPCRALLKGLKARTLADALHERLLIDADAPTSGPAVKSDEPGGVYAEDARTLLDRAQKYTADWQLSLVPMLAVTCAACDHPGASLGPVLHPLGILTTALADVGARLLRDVGVPQESRKLIDPFDGDNLRVEAFDSTMQDAWRQLRPVSQARPLLDVDLLKALIDLQGSRLSQALAEARVTNAEAKQQLGDPAPAAETPTARSFAPGSTIARAQIGRLLSRVLAQAAALARAADAPSIGEAHVLLAHLDRVGSEAGSVYHQLRIAASLRALLTAPAADKADPVASSLFADDLLVLSVFGPVARRALISLAPVAAERSLLDTDLLHGLVNQPLSHLVDALHVMGIAMPPLRRALQPAATSKPTDGASTSPPAASSIPHKHVGPLLIRVMTAAAALARREHCAVIGESHLVRAHIVNVGGASFNLYERFGIDTRRLSDLLEKHPIDAEAPSGHDARKAGLVTDIEAYLNARVVSQADAVARAARALKRMRSGLGEPGQVLGKFFFVGATGVGKTELARAMSDVAFGVNTTTREAHMIRIDCGVFTDKRDVVQLVGAAQGLVGYKEGQLTNGLRDKNQSVILFDEAEKADRAIWQSLLPLFDEGLVREADGTVYDATNCIIVLTSNRGYEEALRAHDAWNQPWQLVRERIQESVWEAVQQYLSPELRGRFGRENIIFFNHFSEADYAKIIDRQLTGLVEEMSRRGIELTFADREEVVRVLTGLAWESRQEGARPVRRLITDRIRDRMVNERTENPDRVKFRFEASRDKTDLMLVS